MTRDALDDALSRLTSVPLDGDLCAPFLAAIEVTGAAISTLGPPLGSQTVCASDALAARLEEIQIDLGEGPCWEALRDRAPVHEPDLARAAGDRWPAAGEALRATGVGGLHAFPLFVGSIDVGSVDIYTAEARPLTPTQIEDTSTLARVAARQVIRRAMAALGDPDGDMPEVAHSRREVHQAAGMIAAQMRSGVDDAAVLLRAHAFAHGRSVRAVAEEVIARRLDFTPGAEPGRRMPYDPHA